jgi:hypothetical protein
MVLLSWQEWYEERDGVAEVALLREHREVDGIEVPLAVKTTTKVGIAFDV